VVQPSFINLFFWLSVAFGSKTPLGGMSGNQANGGSGFRLDIALVVRRQSDLMKL